LNSYLKLCTEFYNIDKPYAWPNTLAFILDMVRNASGPILEPMCGSGRYLLPIVAEGFDIEGVDASPYMLAALKETAKTRNIVPRVSQQFLHEMSLDRQFGFVFIQDASFSLITDREQAQESLRRIRHHMAEGGRFIFGACVGKKAGAQSWPWGGRWVTRPDGATILGTGLGYYDVQDGVSRSIGRYELILDGKLIDTEFESFDLRYYDVADMVQMLRSAGFAEIETLKAHAHRPPDEGDDEILFTAVAN